MGDMLPLVPSTADGLEAYFVKDDPDPNHPNMGFFFHPHIYVEERSSVSDPFGAATFMANVDAFNATSPSVTGDGLSLFFVSNGPTTVDHDVFPYHIYMSSRKSRSDEFGAPTFLANVNATVHSADDFSPFVSTDGQELFFESTRIDGGDIYRATLDGSGFGNTAPMTALNSDSEDSSPVLSSDRLTIYFASGRLGNDDIWTSHRSAPNKEFSAPSPVLELNTSGSESPVRLSADNCTLYFYQEVEGPRPVGYYVATRRAL